MTHSVFEATRMMERFEQTGDAEMGRFTPIKFGRILEEERLAARSPVERQLLMEHVIHLIHQEILRQSN